MRAPSLAIAVFLAQGCAPVTLGTTSFALVNTGGARDGESCVSREICGSSGGSGAVTIPLLVILAAVTAPAFVHYYVLRGDPKRPAAAARTGADSTDNRD